MERFRFVEPDDGKHVALPVAADYNQVVLQAQRFANMEVEGYKRVDSETNTVWQKDRVGESETPSDGSAVEIGTFLVNAIHADHLVCVRYSIDPATNAVTLGSDLIQVAKQPNMRASTFSTMNAGWTTLTTGRVIDGRSYVMTEYSGGTFSTDWRTHRYDARIVTVTGTPVAETNSDAANRVGATITEQAVPGWIGGTTVIHALKLPSPVINLPASTGHEAVSCEWLDLSPQQWMAIQREIVLCAEISLPDTVPYTARVRVMVRCSDLTEIEE